MARNPQSDVLHEIRLLEYADLSTLAGVLECSKASLSRDLEQNWRLQGSRGRITTNRGDFHLVIEKGRWRQIRDQLFDLGLCRVVLDGCSEGSMQFLRLPASDHEAWLIRLACGLRASAPASQADRLHQRSSVAVQDSADGSAA
jgi:hypothetical protein